MYSNDCSQFKPMTVDIKWILLVAQETTFSESLHSLFFPRQILYLFLLSTTI